MTGLFAILGPGPRAEREQWLDAMARGPGDGVGGVSLSWSGGEAGVRVVPDRSTGPSTGIVEDGRGILAVHGDLWTTTLGPRPLPDLMPATLLECIDAAGAESLHGLDGCFAALLWEKKSARAFLFGDPAGVGRLFVLAAGEQLVVASSLFALATHPACSMELDRLAAGEFLTLGYVSGRRTALRGVEELTPGTLLEVRRGTPGRRLRVPALSAEPRHAAAPQDLAGELAALTTEVVRQQVGEGDRVALLLTGGIDSRLVLAALCAAGRRVRAWIPAAATAHDLALAEQVAGAAGVPAVRGPLAWDHLLKAARSALWRTDGLHNALRCHDAGLLSGIGAESDVVVEGLSVLDPSFTLQDVRGGYEPQAAGDPHRVASQFLAASLPGGRELGSLFPRGSDRPFAAAILPELKAHLHEVAKDFLAEGGHDETDLWTMLDRFYRTRELPGLATRAVRQTAGIVRPRLPLLDQRIQAFVRRLPVELRTADRTLHRLAIRQLAPHLTGLPYAASESVSRPGLWSRLWRRMRGAQQDRSCARGPSGRPCAVPAHWTRRHGRLRQEIEELLLRRDAWHHVLLDADYSRFLVQSHLRGDWDGTELIGRLLTLELVRGLLPAREVARR